MALANEVTLIIKARDQASKQVRQINKDLVATQKGTKALDTDFKRVLTNTQKEVKKTSTAMSGLAGSMRGAAAAALGIFTVGAIVNAAQEWTKAQAKLSYVLASMGPEARDAWDKLQPLIGAIAGETDFKQGEVADAWASIVKVTGRSEVAFADLVGALHLAKVFAISTAEAGEILGQAMIGNVEPLRQLTGPMGFSSLDKFLQDIALAAETANTPLDEITGQMAQALEVLGRILNGDLAGAWEELIQGIFGSDEGEDNPGLVKAFAGLREELEKVEVAFDPAGTAGKAFVGLRKELDKVGVAFDPAGTTGTAFVGLREELDKVGVAFDPAGTTGTAITKFADWIGQEVGRAAANAGQNIAAILATAAGLNAAIEALHPALAPGQQTTGPFLDPWTGVGEQPSSGGGGSTTVGGQPPFPINETAYMAAGGIVNSPTRAIIGEAGPEAVIPLNKMGSMGGFTQTVVLNNPSFNDEFGARSATRQINRLTREEFRRHGGAIA